MIFIPIKTGTGSTSSLNLFQRDLRVQSIARLNYQKVNPISIVGFLLILLKYHKIPLLYMVPIVCKSPVPIELWFTPMLFTLSPCFRGPFCCTWRVLVGHWGAAARICRGKLVSKKSGQHSYLVGGDWNHGILWLSHHIGNVIIPTDFHSMIFQRVRWNHQLAMEHGPCVDDLLKKWWFSIAKKLVSWRLIPYLWIKFGGYQKAGRKWYKVQFLDGH
jgi:hypothetical protein